MATQSSNIPASLPIHGNITMEPQRLHYARAVLSGQKWIFRPSYPGAEPTKFDSLTDLLFRAGLDNWELRMKLNEDRELIFSKPA